MPLYEYRCEPCSHQFEKIQRFSHDPISVCPSCGQGPVVKLLSSPAMQFKGSGWYITDYARKSSGGEGGKDKGGWKESSKDSGSSSSSSETKTSSSDTKPSTSSGDKK